MKLITVEITWACLWCGAGNFNTLYLEDGGKALEIFCKDCKKEKSNGFVVRAFIENN